MSFKPDDKLGAFRLVKELGRGATGTVFLAEQTNLGRECALKILAPELVRDKTFLERFRREGKIAASLRHKSIVRIFDLVEDAGNFALAMDYIEGQELRDLLAAEQSLPKTVALDIISHVLEALEYAHNKGIVHRDVKPANIMIENDGSVFLTDFSIARMAGTEKLTQTGMVIGTPEYMAPEQFDGKEVDSRADVYATALILYELLTGQNPFAGDTLAEIIKKQVLVEPPALNSLVDVPQAVVDVVHKGLQKSPDDRFQTAGEMREALMKVDEPILKQSSGSLTQFLSSVELGAISMDDAVIARDKVKEAIDKGFKRRLSIVMLDLAGSSKIKIPNQTLIADRAFQDYRQTINRILDEYGCERYDWSGDGAISLFPEPLGAVDAAVKVQRTVEQVGERHTSLPDALKVRIGIRTGMVYYDPRRTLGEFASRTVDQAGHLEKDCPPGSIRLGDETVKAMGDRYEVVSKGVNRDDIEVFEIDVHSPGNLERTYPPPVSVASQKGEDTLSEPASPTPTHQSSVQAARAPEPQASVSAQQESEESDVIVVEKKISPPTDDLPAVKTPKKETVTVEAVKEGQGSESQELFRPKSETGQRPATVTRDNEAPWWGWKSLGGLFLIWAAAALVRKVLPLGIVNEMFTLFVGLFGLHVAALPFYCLYCLFVGDVSRAKEVAVAGGIFTVIAFIYLAVMTAA